MAEEWGPWIEHDGGEYCPFSAGQTVNTYGGFNGDFEYNEWFVEKWHTKLSGYRHLIRYRIRKPKGLTILQNLLENLPEDVDA